MTVEELQVLVTAKTTGLQRQLNDVTKRLQGVQKQADTISNKMVKTFSRLKNTIVSLGIGKAIAGAFNMARTYEASVQQVNRWFGLYSGALDAWIRKNAKTFGMARADAMKYAAVYGNLLSGFVSNSGQMEKYTEQLLESSAIIASSTGRTIEDVMERIRSGLLGNTESIEDLGINVNVALLETTNAFKQLSNGKSWEKLSFHTQQQIRLMAILEQTSSKFGDSIQNNMNYKLMQLTASLKDTWLHLGQAFMPIVNAILPVLNAMAMALANVTAKIATFMNALFGTNFNAGAGVDQVGISANNAAGGFGNMTDEAKEAGKEAEKAAKKAKAALAPFDELNVLSRDKGSNKDGNEAGDLGTTLDPVTSTLENASESFANKLKEELERLKNLFKQGFEIGLGGNWKERLEDLKNSIEGIKVNLKNIFSDNEVVTAFNGLIDKFVIGMGQEAGSLVSIGTTIGQNLLGGFNKYLEQNQQFIKDKLVGILNVAGEIAELSGGFSVAFADIFSVLGGETAQQVTANIIGMFTNGFLGTTQLALQFGRDILNVLTQPIIDNKDKIKDALENTLKPIETITGALKDVVTNTFEKMFEAYESYLSPAFQNISDGLSSILNNLLDLYNTILAPVLDALSQKVAEFLNGSMQEGINAIITNLAMLGENISIIWMDVIVPLINDLTSLLAPVLGTVAELVVDLALSFGEMLLGAVSGVVEQIRKFSDWCAEHEVLIDNIIVLIGSMATAWGIYEGVQLLANAATVAWGAITTGATAVMAAFSAGGTVATAVTTALGGAIAFLTSPITLTIAAIGALIFIVVQLVRHWDEVKEAAAKCWDWIVEKWNKAGEWFNTTVIEPVKRFFTELWLTIQQKAELAWTFIKGVWLGVSSWFKETIIQPVEKAFTGMWNGVKEVCGNTWTSIKNTVKDGVNGIIGFVNGMINGINSKLHFELPQILGGGEVGFSIPNIPKLAKGGVLKQSTIVEAGEYPGARSNPEIVTPQNIMYDTVVSANAELASSFFQAARMIVGAIENKDTNVVIGDETIGRSSVQYINKQTKLKGVSPIQL